MQDCYSGLRWCIEHAEELAIDAQKVAVAGSSAGGGLAAGLALYVRDQKEFDIHDLRLRSPMLDDRTSISRDPPYAGEFVWIKKSNYFGWKSVLGHEPGQEGTSEYFVPARAKSLAGLPPTYISIGSIDLFIDEALLFAKQLVFDGVLVELHVYQSLSGGLLTGKYKAGQAAQSDSRAATLKGYVDTLDPELAENEHKFMIIEKLQQLANEARISLADMAIAFTQSHPSVTATLWGPRTLEQLKAYISGAELRLGTDVLDAIDAIVPPGKRIDDKEQTWTPEWMSAERRRRH